MQLPKRKPPTYNPFQTDPLLTKEKFAELQNKLNRLLADRPRQADEVHRLAQNGDFSENAEYQMAKGKLRGMNDMIDRLQYQLDHSEIIEVSDAATVQIGHTVVVVSNGTQRAYHLLGSTETNPQAGVISHNSPIGSALIGHRVGDVVRIKLPSKEIEYTIISIE